MNFNSIRSNAKLLSVLLAFAWVISACVKTEFDEPPTGGAPVNITANTTIAAIKALHNGSNVVISDTSTAIIKGQVIMDDKSGNFYKTIVIQDATGGIEVKFNDGYLYNKYPIGRNVYIKCAGLLISDYNGVKNLNGGIIIENGVPSTRGLTSDQAELQVFKGEFEALIAPKVKKVNELLTADISTLVQLEDMEFAAADANQPYADAVSQSTVNRTIQDCNQAELFLRTSGFANFASANTPIGKGTITGVYSVFRNDQQFYIRDTNDVQMTGPRCGVNPNLSGISIADLRAAFASGSTSGPQDKKISGVIISDKDFVNTDVRNVVIQDGNAGIAVRFSAIHTFAKGDKIDIDVSGLELSEFNGLLQINNVPANNAIKTGTGTITPRVATITDILANKEAWESTLIQVKGAMFTSTGTYNGSKNLQDATGTMAVFTRGAATFSGNPIPSGTIELTAIVSQFTDPQLIMRSPADVSGGTTGGGGGGGTNVDLINEAFDGVTNNGAVSITGWQNIAAKGTRTWLGKTFMTEKYVQATSFNSTEAEEDMWLISPPITLTTQKTLNFSTAMAFYKHDGLTVLYSSNFDGTNVGTATWQPLTATLANATSGDNTWVVSGPVALPIAPKGYIAFRYVGTGAANTTTYRVDNISVQ
jgi:hypothetical protein